MPKTIFSLAFEGIKRRKRQSLLIFFVLLVSFTFSIVLLSYTSSISSTNSQLRFDTYGTWYGAITDTTNDDLEFLESLDSIDKVGTNTAYGTVSGRFNVGTIDQNLIDMGISLEEGEFPQTSGEIAIETSTISALGYNYQLGQEIEIDISVPFGDSYVYITRTFTICGIINDYSSIWEVTSGRINNIVISEEDAESILSEASFKAEQRGYEQVSPYVTLFFTAKSGQDDTIESDVNTYLRKTCTDSQVKTVVVNTAITKNRAEAGMVSFYFWIVFIVTIVAVAAVYILQMQSDIKRIVRLRGIGATKGQLYVLVAIETIILCIPSLILGTIIGLFGIWALLSISVYSGSVPVTVDIPFTSLSTAFVLWTVGILAVRMLTIQVAFLTPLTGTSKEARKRKKFYTSFRKILILLTVIVLCTSALFTYVNTAEPLYEYQYWKSRWSYNVSAGVSIIDNPDVTAESTITDEILNLLSEVPGVTSAKGWSLLTANLSIGGAESTLANVYVMDYDSWSDYIDFSGIDIDSYNKGDSVLLSYTSTSFSHSISTSESEDGIAVSVDTSNNSSASNLPSVGADVTLSIDLTDYDGNYNTVSVDTIVAKVGTNEYTKSLGVMTTQSYDIICSKAFLEKVLASIPEGFEWDSHYGYTWYGGDVTGGFLRVSIYTDLNAEYLSTDKGVANITSNYSLSLDNQRELNSTNVQLNQQSLIMIIVSGVCIAVVVLLILVSTLRLETESEKKRYGILQAIGMSKRQRNMELIRKSVVRSVIAIVAAVVCYLGYYLIMNISTITAGESAISVLATMFATLAGYGLTVPVLLTILAATFLVTFAICFGTKLSLNRYTLMEMLHGE